MNALRVERGIAVGLVAAMAMGMWMMLYYWASDRGFWAPLGYIGHFFLRRPDITDPFQVVVGAVVHMMMSTGIAVALLLLLPARRTGASIVRGVVIGVAIWVVMQYGVLNAFDEVAYDGLVPWAFAVAHVIYGSVVGFMLGVPQQATRVRESLTTR